MNRAYAALLTIVAIVAVGFGIAVMLARMTPASQEHTWWRGLLDAVFARDAVAGTGGDAQRPPIVVRGPSLYVDGGDRLNPDPQWRGWTLVSSSSGTSIWKPDQAAGAPVREFEVLALNAIGTATCPLAPFLADRVELIYAGTPKSQSLAIHTFAGKDNKPEPVIETTLQLTSVPGNGTAPDALAYTANGVLTGFNASYQGRAAAACTFNAQGGAYLRIAPVR